MEVREATATKEDKEAKETKKLSNLTCPTDVSIVLSCCSTVHWLGTESNIRQCDGLTASSGKGQKENQVDQGGVKELWGGLPLAVVRCPGPPGLPFGSSLASLC